MLRLRQLIDWLDDLERIISDIQLSFLNLRRMNSPKDTGEERVLKDAFFRYFEHQLRFTLTVQLCKLFVNSDIERRNFQKLFNRFKLEPYDEALKKRLRNNRGHNHLVVYKRELVEMLVPWIQEIDSRKSLIHRIKVLRDRVYAHTDPAQSLPEVSLAELEDLVNLSINIFKELTLRIMGEQYILEQDEAWSVDPVIRALASDNS